MPESLTTETHLIQLLRRLRRVGPEQQPPFEDVGITSAQLALLERAAAQPGCSLQDMADGLGVTPPTVSVGVRRLEEVGLLERHPDPADGRAWQFVLTAAGVALWERVQRYRGEKARRLLAGLAPEEQQTLLTLLERALDAAEKEEPAAGTYRD
ncbi:MAG: MarR family transcriptional regulator [Anaerolineae bacterium]|nr:MarR family transcriptional regulator [Anaerolineae bacterium]